MAMLPEERRDLLHDNDIKDKDIFIFRWRIAQILCEAPITWGGLTDVELLIRAHLHGYQNKQLEQDYLKGRSHNVYTAIIEEVMTDLVARQVAIREEGTIFYGDREMNRYRRGPALNEGSCPEVTRIGLWDQNTYNRLFPPIRGNE
jgi:hypothetical protein